MIALGLKQQLPTLAVPFFPTLCTFFPAIPRREVIRMSATVYNLFTVTDLAPSATFSFVWNNIPAGKAYRVDAHPFYPGSTLEGFNNTTEAEVTRFWRRTRQIEKPGSIGVIVEVHNDILGEVKNVGGHKLNFELYLVVFA
jgi:hypothetical protein